MVNEREKRYGKMPWNASLPAAENLWFLVLLAGGLVGAFAIGYVLIHGHIHGSRYPWAPPWGILIATYEIFVLASGGLSLLVGVGRWLKFPVFVPFAGRSLQMAALALIIGLGLAAIELSHPMRLTIQAEMNRAFYDQVVLTELLFLVYVLWIGLQAFSLKCRGRLMPMILALLGWTTALTALFRMGEALRFLEAPAAWHGPFFVIRTTLTALIMGAALLPLFVRLCRRFQGGDLTAGEAALVAALDRSLTVLLLGEILWVAGSTGGSLLMGAESVSQALWPLAIGPLAGNFWILEVALGIVIPLVLLWRFVGRHSCFGVLAGLSALVGQFFLHYDRVLAFQFRSMLDQVPGDGSGLLNGVPCLPKFAVTSGAIALYLLLFVVSVKISPPDIEDRHDSRIC